MFGGGVLKDREDEDKFGDSFDMFLAVRFVGEGYWGAVVIEDSAIGDRRMFGVSGDVAQDFFFWTFDDAVGKDNKTVFSEIKTPIDDGIESWLVIGAVIA